MSSVRIDVSGARALSSTINSQESTSAQMPTKHDDNLSVQMGNCPGLSLIIPLNFKLSRMRTKSGGEYIVLTGPADQGASLSIYTQQPEQEEGKPGMHPHATLSVGKHIKNPYLPGGSFELTEVEVIHERVGDLIPPTPEGE